MQKANIFLQTKTQEEEAFVYKSSQPVQILPIKETNVFFVISVSFPKEI